MSLAALPIALALIAAWSPAHYQMSTQTTIRESANLGTYGGMAYYETDGRREIEVNASLENPVSLAIVLTHELTHQLDYANHVNASAAAFEDHAYTEDSEFLAWFSRTYGPPHPVAAMDVGVIYMAQNMAQLKPELIAASLAHSQ